MQHKRLYFFYKCPHCGIDILIYDEEINCNVFRCGLLKANLEQIPPHATKAECDFFVANKLIYGCGKPFQLVNGNLEQCDYI